MRFPSFPPSKADIETHFGSKILSRAKDIVAEDMIRLLERSKSHLTAKVQGSEPQPYNVIIAADGDYRCSCPSDIQPCKHVAAVLLYAAQHKSENDVDLNEHLQKLDPVAAKTLLLDLANLNDVRPIIIKRLLIKTSTIPKGVIKALKKILRDGTNIEHEGELGDVAFKELETLGVDERSDEAWQIYELLDTYEPDYEYYDPEDESGDAYWEDRQSDWQGLALLHWGTAEVELGRGEAALKTILNYLGANDSMWQAALTVAKHVKGGSSSIESWLKRQNSENNHYLKRFQREFLQQFGTPKDYEKHLREKLETPNDYSELVKFLQEQKRDGEALELAAKSIRQAVKRELKDHDDLSPYWGIYKTEDDPLLIMLNLLKTHQASFEWEEAAFIFQPTLGHYRYLKKQAEFASARHKLLSVPMDTALKIDLLLEDDDQAGLEKLLNQRPTPANALKLKQLFPERSKMIFKKAALDEIERGSREHYREAVRWSEEYGLLEDKPVFKNWLENVLETHNRRPALQDEFKKLKAKFLSKSK